MMIFGVCFVLYLIKLSSGKGFLLHKILRVLPDHDKYITLNFGISLERCFSLPSYLRLPNRRSSV